MIHKPLNVLQMAMRPHFIGAGESVAVVSWVYAVVAIMDLLGGYISPHLRMFQGELESLFFRKPIMAHATVVGDASACGKYPQGSCVV
jgi:hypothetical protein